MKQRLLVGGLIVAVCVAVVLFGVLIWSVDNHADPKTSETNQLKQEKQDLEDKLEQKADDLQTITAQLSNMVNLHKAKSEELEAALKQIPTSSQVEAAANLMGNMDQTVDPCTDFASYSCGTWLKETIIPEGSYFMSTTMELSEAASRLLYILLTDLQDNEAPEEDYLVKMKEFYKSCMDVGKMDTDEEQDLIEDKITEIREATTKAAAVQIVAELDVALFFDMSVQRSLGEDPVTALFGNQGGIALSSKDEYQIEDENVKTHNKYMAYIKELWDNYAEVTAQDIDATVIADKVFNFDSCLAHGMESLADNRKNFDSMPGYGLSDAISSLSALYFENQLKARLSTNEVVNPDDIKVYFNSSYIKHATKCIENHFSQDTDLKDYVATKFMEKYGKYGKKSWRDIKFDYGQAVLSEAHWKTCVQITKDKFPEITSRVYVDSAFKTEEKTEMLQMIDDVKSAFKSILPNLEWMDNSTMNVAMEKADAMIFDIGYPDWILDDNILKELVSSLQFEIYFTDNILILDKAATAKAFDKAGQPYSTDNSLYGSMASANAYYYPSENKMTFLAGILQPPWYDGLLPKYITYGATGAIVGHELTHGFDDQGSKYDKGGQLADWFTTETRQMFDERAECLVRQYNDYTFMGHNVNGAYSLGENMADLGGLRQALLAYRSWVARAGVEEATLPGMEISNEQALFVAYAQTWCGKVAESRAKFTAQESVHAPDMVRINGPVSNMEEFATAFKCKGTDAMNPVDKCKVW